MFRFLSGTLLCASLSACMLDSPALIAALRDPEDAAYLTQTAPPGAAPGTCWGKYVTPALIETVTEQVLIQPAEIMSDGTVRNPAIYRTETRQEILRERAETWFETPCPDTITPQFVASLQRALNARGFNLGRPSGVMDARTRSAVRRYQQQRGLDSGILSLDSARLLGLVAVPRSGG